MSRINLTLACGVYDRTIPLQDGTVRPEGIDLNFIPMSPGELFRRQARDVEFDIAEFSLATHCVLTARGDRRLVAIPVFPSRKFRHSHIFVNRERVQRPEDLRGKRVGSSEYQQTAAVWIRGILADDYAIEPEDVTWVLGGLNRPKPHGDRVPITLPDSIVAERLPENQCLNDLLVAGEIDAVISAEIPTSLNAPEGVVCRLFEDNMRVEQEYFRKTGIFPIMHIIVIRRGIYETHPWIARNLYYAFSEALSEGRSRLSFDSTLYCALPWLSNHLEHLDRLSDGVDLFSYGVSSSRANLETFLRYCFEQHLIDSPLGVEDLFVFDEP